PLTFARLFRPELARTSPVPIEFIEISLQTVRADRPDAVILDGVRSTLGSRPLDLVVTLGGLAAGFAQKHKTEIFPETPMLITAVDGRFLDGGPLPVGTTAVTV